jgi:hypothetical protein
MIIKSPIKISISSPSVSVSLVSGNPSVTEQFLTVRFLLWTNPILFDILSSVTKSSRSTPAPRTEKSGGSGARSEQFNPDPFDESAILKPLRLGGIARIYLQLAMLYNQENRLTNIHWILVLRQRCRDVTICNHATLDVRLSLFVPERVFLLRLEIEYLRPPRWYRYRKRLPFVRRNRFLIGRQISRTTTYLLLLLARKKVGCTKDSNTGDFDIEYDR